LAVVSDELKTSAKELLCLMTQPDLKSVVHRLAKVSPTINESTPRVTNVVKVSPVPYISEIPLTFLDVPAKQVLEVLKVKKKTINIYAGLTFKNSVLRWSLLHTDVIGILTKESLDFNLSLIFHVVNSDNSVGVVSQTTKDNIDRQLVILRKQVIELPSLLSKKDNERLQHLLSSVEQILLNVSKNSLVVPSNDRIINNANINLALTKIINLFNPNNTSITYRVHYTSASKISPKEGDYFINLNKDDLPPPPKKRNNKELDLDEITKVADLDEITKVPVINTSTSTSTLIVPVLDEITKVPVLDEITNVITK
jgi:hypothetical protein